VASDPKIIIIATSISASTFFLVVIVAILSYRKIKKDLELKLERDLQQQLQESKSRSQTMS
jgi:low affinity Fe/Cu permease